MNRMAKGILLAALLVGSVSSAVSGQALAPDALMWRLQEGAQFKLIVTEEMKTIAIQAGQSFEIPQQRTIEGKLKVTQVSPEGQATLVLTFSRLRLNSRTPFTGEIDLDSNAVDPGAPEPIQEIQALFAQVPGQQLSFQMDPQGRISQLQWLKELPASLTSQPLLAGLLQLPNLATALGSGGQLPAQVIAPQETWTYDITRTTPAGPLVFTTTVTNEGPISEKSATLKFATQTEVKLMAQPDESGATYRVKDAQISGAAQFATAAGIITSANEQQRFTLAVDKDGVSAEQKVSRTTQFSLTPLP